MEQFADIVELLVRAGFNQTAALIIAILAAVVVVGGLYAIRRWWAKVGDQPLELKLKAGNSRIKFVRKPSPPRSG